MFAGGLPEGFYQGVGSSLKFQGTIPPLLEGVPGTMARTPKVGELSNLKLPGLQSAADCEKVCQ